MTLLEKIVTHTHVSMFGVRRHRDGFVAECFLRREVTITARTGPTPEAAMERLWDEIQQRFPDRNPAPSYPMPPGL